MIKCWIRIASFQVDQKGQKHWVFTWSDTGKSLSEALIFASTKPQYDDRLFIVLQVQYMKIPSLNLGRTCCVQKLFLTFRTIFVHMFSPCSAKRKASDKDLSVWISWWIQLHISRVWDKGCLMIPMMFRRNVPTYISLEFC